MKKIGIFGLSGDPPHISHKRIIDYCIKNNLVDEVWVVPSYLHTQKKNIATYDQRFKMCEMMFEGSKRIKVSMIDVINKSGTMFELIYKLNECFNSDNKPEYDFSIIIGKDCADNIESWYKWNELINENTFIVFDRGDYRSKNIKNWYINGHHYYTISGCDFSSSYIRKCFFERGNYNLAKMLTCEKVVEYCFINEIYRRVYDN